MGVGFPRLRGDGPRVKAENLLRPKVPPPARGWSGFPGFVAGMLDGSPACAGMVPAVCPLPSNDIRFPRLRGDGPVMPIDEYVLAAVPPPARGWSPPTTHG